MSAKPTTWPVFLKRSDRHARQLLAQPEFNEVSVCVRRAFRPPDSSRIPFVPGKNLTANPPDPLVSCRESVKPSIQLASAASTGTWKCLQSPPKGHQDSEFVFSQSPRVFPCLSSLDLVVDGARKQELVGCFLCQPLNRRLVRMLQPIPPEVTPDTCERVAERRSLRRCHLIPQLVLSRKPGPFAMPKSGPPRRWVGVSSSDQHPTTTVWTSRRWFDGCCGCRAWTSTRMRSTKTGLGLSGFTDTDYTLGRRPTLDPTDGISIVCRVLPGIGRLREDEPGVQIWRLWLAMPLQVGKYPGLRSPVISAQ